MQPSDLPVIINYQLINSSIQCITTTAADNTVVATMVTCATNASFIHYSYYWHFDSPFLIIPENDSAFNYRPKVVGIVR